MITQPALPGSSVVDITGIRKDNPPLVSLGREKLVTLFAWLQDGYLSEPDGVAPRGKINLAPKSIANIHANLSSFWLTCPPRTGPVGERDLRWAKRMDTGRRVSLLPALATGAVPPRATYLSPLTSRL